MNIKEFNTLTKSEIKKVNKAGKGQVGEYYTEKADDMGFMNVTCSVFDNEFNEIIATVQLIVCLWDRRKSWVAQVKGA